MFYVNIDTKLFTSSQWKASDSKPCKCHGRPSNCGDSDRPVFLSTCHLPYAHKVSPQKIHKPVLMNYQEAVVQITFLDNEGLPVDISNYVLGLAVDNTYSHSDSLICPVATGVAVSPLDGIAEFHINCSSYKFQKVVSAGIPASQVIMEITAYPAGSSTGSVWLQDRGIRLCPKLYWQQGEPQLADPNYYNKQQVDAIVLALGGDVSDSTTGVWVNGYGEPLDYQGTPGDVYLDLLTNIVYFRKHGEWVQQGSLNVADMAQYYTKPEVDAFITALSNSINNIDGKFDNYYTTLQTDAFISELSNSIESVKSSVNFLAETKMDVSDALLLEEHLQTQIDTKISFPEVGTKGQFLQRTSNSAQWADLPLGNYYTKAEVDNIVSSLSDSIQAVRSSLSNYYTKGQTEGLLNEKAPYVYVDSRFQQISNSIAAIRDAFGNYYTKLQVDGFVKNLSDSINVLSQNFQNYYTKPEIDELLRDLSNSIDLSDYYTKQEVDDIAQVLSDSIERTNLRFNNYFTKEQVLQLISDHSGSGPVIDPYTAGKGLMLQSNTFYIEADEGEDTQKYLNVGEHSLGLKGISQDIEAAQSNANNYTDGKLQNYYTKSQVDQIVANLSNSVDLSAYYTKGQVDAIASSLSNSIMRVQQRFSDYYTSSQVDSLVSSLSNSLQEVKVSLGNYYTKSELDSVLQSISDSLHRLDGKFSSYYTSAETDTLLEGYASNSTVSKFQQDVLVLQSAKQDISDAQETEAELRELISEKFSLPNGGASGQFLQKTSDSTQWASVDLSEYYTKSQLDPVLASLSDSIQSVRDNFSNYYTKVQVDELLAGLSNSSPAYVPFDTVDSSDARTYITFPFFRVPVGLLTEKGRYYPVQKASVVLDYSNSTVTVILDPYLAYEDDSAFTGTWLCFFASGGSDSLIQVQLSGDNYYTKEQVDIITGALSDSIAAVKSSLSNYYVKSQIDTFVTALSDSIQAVRDSLSNYYTKLQTATFIQALSNSIESVKIQLTQKLDVPPAGLPGDVLMLYSDSYGWSSLPLREISTAATGIVTLNRQEYGRWILTGEGNISLGVSNWDDGLRGEVVVDTSKQVISIPADWVVPDALWDAWTDTPGVYCLQMRKQGGVIYAHALVPFSAYQDSSQQIPINLSSRLQAVEQAVIALSDSISALDARVATLQGKVDDLAQDEWITLQWAASMSLSPVAGSRQKLTLLGDTVLTSPTLSYTYPSLTLQISKTSAYSFTNGGIIVIASQTTILSWYYDGAQTRRLPIQFLGD